MYDSARIFQAIVDDYKYKDSIQCRRLITTNDMV